MKELVKRIAKTLCYMNKEDMTQTELSIADMLVDEGILKEHTEDTYTSFVLVD